MKSKLISKELKKKILKKITFDEEYVKKLDRCVLKFLSRLKGGVEDLKLPLKIKLGGSYAKDTYLKDSFDVDIFCIFREKKTDAEKEDIVISLLNYTNIKYRIKHGSRRYFQGSYEAQEEIIFDFECVPTQEYEDVNAIENSTDASIFHVNFFNSQKKLNPQLPDEVRLAKQWFKAQDLYGAESYIGGFSGHSIECLIVKLKTFENLLFYLSTVKKGSRLTFDSIHSSFDMSKDKFSALAIQDPIISVRNALTALEDSTFYKAKFKSLLAIENKLKLEDFEISIRDYELFKQDILENRENDTFLLLEFIFFKNEESSDSIGSKVKKIIRKVEKYISKLGFSILHSDFMYDTLSNKILCKIELVSSNISIYTLTKGPSLELDSSILRDYLSSHKQENIIVLNGDLYIKYKREIKSIKEFAHKYSNKEFFLDTFGNKPLDSLCKFNMYYS